MKVYFSASSGDISKHIGAYRRVRATILANGHSLTRDWIDQAYKYALAGNEYSRKDTKRVYALSIAALQEADVVILDATKETFNMGYQAGLAVHYKKPLLVLTSNQKAHISFLIGEPNMLKQIEVYSKLSDIDPVVKRFLYANDPSDKDTRFNMVLGLNLHNFLRWEAASSGRTKAQIVRDILERHIADKSK